MGQSQDPRYQTQPLGSPAPILWYESLPVHVKQLYDLRGKFSKEPVAMVIFAEAVCEAFTVWTLEELFKKKKVEDLWEALSASKIRRFQDICNDGVNEIYTALSGDRIKQAPFWEKLMQ